MRKPLRVREESRRTLDQRLTLRFPRLVAPSLRLIGRLPPRSRLRQAALWRAVRLAMEAYNRRDLEAVVAGWDPEFEYRPDPVWVKSGLVEPSYHGVEGYRRYIATADEVWGGENLLKPTEASGVPLTESYALVSTIKDGRLVSHQEYFDHDHALGAVGLRE